MFERFIKWARDSFRATDGQTEPISVSRVMSRDIDIWSELYTNGGSWVDPKDGLFSLRLPATIASEVSRLVTSEAEIAVTGSRRAEFLQESLDPFLRNLRFIIEPACALGGAVFKPYIHNDRILIDVIQADSFVPIGFDSTGRLQSCIFLQQVTKGDAIYTRIERHSYEQGVYLIENMAFVSRNSYNLGKRIPLDEVPEWSDLEAAVEIRNVDRPLFSYFRMPQANRADRQSPLGASIYAEAVDLIREADVQFSRYLWEFEGGQMAVDIAEDLLIHTETGSVEVPKLQERLYRSRGVGHRDGDFYQIFAPNLRDESYKTGFNSILQRIEFNCGLAYGTLSDPQVSTSRTATEIVMSKQRSYSTVRDIQLSLENALEDLIYAIDRLASLYGLAPAGAYEVNFDWDDSIVSDPHQRKQMFWQYVTAGKFPFWKYLVEFEGYTEEEARDIQAESSDSFTLFPAQE